jgi:hypothetical protein
MRHGSSSRRSRNRPNNKKSNNKSRVYDSNGPDVRIRGTAHQIFDKYSALAKDSQAAGDYVQAESYMQYAEHYQRIISDWHQIVADAAKGIDVDADDYGENTNPPPQRHHKPRAEQSSSKKSEDDLGLPKSITKDTTKELQGA